jgi:hypothetical protein
MFPRVLPAESRIVLSCRSRELVPSFCSSSIDNLGKIISEIGMISSGNR